MEDRVFQSDEPPARRAARASLLALIGFVGLCLLVGAAGGAATAHSVTAWYNSLVPPPLAPPNWVFAPVWTTLYVMMGVAAWLIWRPVTIANHRKQAALRLWGWQLLLNAIWSPAFFGLQSTGLGLAIIVPLWISIALTIRAFWPLNRAAAWLMVPYLAWVSFATYLNAGLWWLNRG